MARYSFCFVNGSWYAWYSWIRAS